MKISLNELNKMIGNAILNEMVMYHGGPKGITKFQLYGDNVEINSRLMGTGVYLTSDKVEAESYSRGHLYTLEVPDDNGGNYLDFVKAVPDELLNGIVEEFGNIIDPNKLLKSGRISLGYLLGEFRLYYAKLNPNKPNHYGDTLLNDFMLKHGIIGHRNGTTYVLYDPSLIRILS